MNINICKCGHLKNTQKDTKNKLGNCKALRFPSGKPCLCKVYTPKETK